MYLDFYGFTEKPFFVTPNPRFIFFSKIHKEAFALLLYGINSRFGFIELTGEVGTGKTTVLRTLLSQLTEETYRTALIFNPSQSATDLMRAVNREYGISAASDNVAELLEELNRFLLRENAAGKLVVLVIDEAQNLTPAVLEQVRLISNLETDTNKLIQIILAGQPELARLLQKPELRQINQRIALRYHLRPLGRQETKGYIEHRIGIAGGLGRVIFTASAISWLYRYSRGTPRLVNILCDRALLIGYTEDTRKISGRIVTLAFKDVMLKPAFRLPPLAWISAAALAVVCTGILSAAPAWLAKDKHSAPMAAPPAVAAQLQSSSATISNQNSPAGFKEALAKEVPLLSETKTALQGFNTLAALWNAPPTTRLGSNRLPLWKELKRQAGGRKLELTPFKGSFDELLRLDSPALIALSNGSEAGILVALTGADKGKVTIAPPLLGRDTFTVEELTHLWSGRAYIPWRNPGHLPTGSYRGAAGVRVKKLQALMQEAGLSKIKVNGYYDDATIEAIREFQKSRKLKETGMTDPFTLICLYQAVKGTSLPALTEKKQAGGGI